MPDNGHNRHSDRMRPSPLTRGITGVYTAAAAGVVGVGSWLLKRSGQWPANGIRERWARELPEAPIQHPIWLHAASMGEVRIAGQFAEELRKNGQTVVCSAMTEAGYQLTRDLFTNDSPSFRVPFDLPGPIRRVIRHFAPKAVVLIETEWWPNLLIEASRADLPVFIINGRLSEKAYRRYRLGRSYWQQILRAVHFFYMRSEDDAERLRRLGVDPTRVSVLGTMKSLSDPVADARTAALVQSLKSSDDRVWIAGCTRPGEEEIILDAYDTLRAEFPTLKLWLAPRHASRFGHVANILERQGRSMVRLSELDGHGRMVAMTPIVLIDRLGILAHLYQHADVAFIGGSLLPYGGHNPLEPALVGTPVCFGHHMNDQRDAVELLANSGLAAEVWGSESLALATAEFLRSGSSVEDRRLRGDSVRARIADTRSRVAADLIARLQDHLTFSRAASTSL
ncbi:MAG: lipid IV(A) 3-deoxy-D-manno-octulosonic acid transferase [Candidatus Zixiibacteriota bacterium]